MSLVRFTLDTLQCHKKGRATNWRKTEPYMWNIFFKLCNPQVRLNEKFGAYGRAEFHFSEGSHGNLGAGHLDTGDVVAIPRALGYWESELKDVEVPYFDYAFPGIAGCICVLMEQHNVSGKGAEGGHQALNDYVRNSVNQAITDFHVKHVDVKDIEGSIARYIDREIGKFTQGIEQRVGGAVMQAQSFLQNAWSLLDKDELIGFQVWHFNRMSLAEAGQVPLAARWASYAHGDWEVRGRVELVG